MPDASYEIYRKATDDAGISTLIHLGFAPATSAQGAVRAWFKAASPEGQANASGKTLVVIPSRSHHELAPKVETQTRLAF